MTPLRRNRKLNRRSAPTRLKVVTRSPTPKERRAAGHRSTCDICHAKISEPLGRGKKVLIWSFTVKGAKGKVFNRCQRHLKNKVLA